MALAYRFTCPLPNGVHARPASALEEVARTAAAAVTLVNLRTGRSANAKSVLAIVALDIRLEDSCELVVEGSDERAALLRLRRFLEDEFPASDEPLAAPSAGVAVALPPVLREAEAHFLVGTPVVPGIGAGRAVYLDALEVPTSIPTTGATDVSAERDRLEAALVSLERRYDNRLEVLAPGVEADVLKAHRSVARDPEFRAKLESVIAEGSRTAAGAIAAAELHFTSMLLATGSALLHERALDVRDVCRELLVEIYGDQVRRQAIALPEHAVCLADTLTPGDFLALDRSRMTGLVLAHGGTTSHTVILARSFGIPTLVGVAGLEPGTLTDVIVDGDLGLLITRMTPSAARYYRMEQDRSRARRERLATFASRVAETRDGRRIEVAANIATAAEAAGVFESGAEGIGLFRTEMLFVDRDEAPTEDEQYVQYRAAALAAGTRPVIIRTLDVGGDKPLPYLRLPHEENPFLGSRAIRMYPEFEAPVRAQVRAVLRASAHGTLRLMTPMVTSVEEAAWIRRIVREEQAALDAQDVPFDRTLQVGAMIEVPAAAFHVSALARECDFFSIGSNDLLQYFVAVDRANPRVASLYDPLHPAFLRLLKHAVEAAHAAGRWIGLCGEIGGQRRMLPLLVGLGLDEISMAAPAIPTAKADLAGLSSEECRALLERALSAGAASEVASLLEGFTRGRPAPLAEPDLVAVAVEAETKAEAIKAAVDRLFVAGRTARPREVEEAVWRREAVYSTGFGFGFAIPHCKTDAVESNSLVVLKLSGAVEWGSLDGQPVRLLILLAIRESEQATEHMRVLAALARRVMHEEFRESLLAEDNPERLCAFLRETVGV